MEICPLTKAEYGNLSLQLSLRYHKLLFLLPARPIEWSVLLDTYTRKSGIFVGAMTIEGNVYNGHTLKPQLLQVRELIGGIIKKTIANRGYRMKGNIGSIEIVLPKVLKKESYYMKKQREARCRSRAGIEGLISHLKYDHRMRRNYLKGVSGDKINTILAATAYNMMKWMRWKQQEIFDFIFWLFYRPFILFPASIVSRIR